MPKKIEAYKCECEDCLRASHTCNKYYKTYSGAYQKERNCPMAAHNRSCVTCKFKNLRYNEHTGFLDEYCEKHENDIFRNEIRCSDWEISERHKRRLENVKHRSVSDSK